MSTTMEWTKLDDIIRVIKIKIIHMPGDHQSWDNNRAIFVEFIEWHKVYGININLNGLKDNLSFIQFIFKIRFFRQNPFFEALY